MKKILYVCVATALLAVATVSCKPKPVAVAEVKLNKTELELVRGDEETLVATVSPNDAENLNVTWSSSNSNVVTVDNNGLVIAVGMGKAIITVTSEEGGKTAKCNVEVFHPAEPKMVRVESGTFWMGCTQEQSGICENNENPKHQVKLSTFKMGVTEVTQEQWKMIMGSYNPSGHNAGHIPGLPVENITWNEVQQFIKALNDSTGKNYRLPTEAEWEYAARGGNKSKGYIYSGSNNLDEVAWYSENSANPENSQIETHPVGLKAPNELGLYDMSGNVLEWCSDWYDPANGGAYPSAELQTNPTGPTDAGKMNKINRGGWYNGTAENQRVSARKFALGGKQYNGTNARFETVGFRLVLSE